MYPLQQDLTTVIVDLIGSLESNLDPEKITRITRTDDSLAPRYVF